MELEKKNCSVCFVLNKHWYQLTVVLLFLLMLVLGVSIGINSVYSKLQRDFLLLVSFESKRI